MNKLNIHGNPMFEWDVREEQRKFILAEKIPVAFSYKIERNDESPLGIDVFARWKKGGEWELCTKEKTIIMINLLCVADYFLEKTASLERLVLELEKAHEN